MVYKDKENNLQTTLYRELPDQQSYLHAKSEYPSALKNSIAYSQTLRLKTICSTEDEYQSKCAFMKQKLSERKYNEDHLNKQMEKVVLIERKELLQNNEKINSKKNIPTQQNIPNISEIVRKNWYILQINPEFRNVFVNKPAIAFKRYKNIRDLIDGHLIKDGKVAKKKLEKRQDKSKTCYTTRSALCYMQMVNTNTFKSNQTKRVFNINHTITCKSQWITYLL